MPVNVLTGEALDLAYFITQHWEPVSGKQSRPGMKAALLGGLFHDSVAQDLRELVVAVSNVHSSFRSVNAASLQAPVERGEFLLSEIKHCLEFIFDDGITDDNDAELTRLSESHTDTSTHDALALSLEGFAYYGQKFRDKLAQLPEFDPAMLDEALVIANRLRSQSGLKLSQSALDEQRQLVSLRNRLITLLATRVNEARSAARFVFRNHPDVARLAGSSFQRRGRARRRAAERARSEAQQNGKDVAAPAVAG